MIDGRAPAGGWRDAVVRRAVHLTPRGVALRLEVRDRVDHWAGQHYVVRLTAQDSYTAQRSYSVASAPSDPLVELCVERLDDGEVSTYLADVVEPDDELEVRGPIGGWFVWDGDSPALAVAGGSGLVPVVAMLRQAEHVGRTDRLRVAVSSPTCVELAYADELNAAGALIALSRESAERGRAAGRLTAAELEPLLLADATCFVCGSASFAEAASEMILSLGVAAERIRIERFGPSG